MKKLLSIILICLITLSLFGGCSAAEGKKVNGGTYGKSAMVELGDGLYYDSITRIVYWWNGCLDGVNYAVTPSPYYAPNGLPYLYDPVTNTFIEIKEE